MGRVFTAFRAFFGSLFNAETAARVEQALKGEGLPAPQPLVAPPTPELKPIEVKRPEPKKPTQSEAITLLATLQREARLVDFLKEDLSGYADEQVGAAARAIQRDSAKVLERFFALQPVVADEEGARVNVPAGFDAARYRLTGKVTGDAPFAGTLQHHGWEATKCELPQFTGSDSAAKTVAPAEVEIG
ncbi:MAG: DUF2760 domain-containing protein [Planctomycetota bacterium]